MYCNGYKINFGLWETWVQILALPLSMTLGKWFNLFKSQFPYL